LEKEGITIDVLAWSPADQAKHLSAMGRPDKKWCGSELLRVEQDSIIPANDPPTEAGLLLDFAADQSDFEVFAAAPESAVALAQEIAWRDAESYLPEGRGLAQTESAEILLGWDEFAATRRLRDLRVLLQKPAFLAFFVAEAAKAEKFTANDALEACDLLIGQRLCENVSSAESWIRHARNSPEKKAREFYCQDDLVQTVEKLLAHKLDGRGMLSAVNDRRGTVEAGSFAAKELAAIAEVTGQFDNTALLRALPEDMRRAAAKADILRKRIFPRASAEAIEVQGWLEAPWSSAKTLVIAGCREGALPSGTYDDPFLPDKAKENLGLITQDKRLARDAYLLSCLLSSRPAAQVRLGFSRFRNQGEPNRPSRLLFSCANSKLPHRSEWLLKPAPRSERKDKNEVGFKLHIPKPGAKQWPPPSIRVTAFKSYLECPLRFYLANILKIRKFDPDAREIPATDFGTVMHKVLEDFALDESLANLRDPDEIARKLSEILDAVVPRLYGEKPSPVVRVQIENMRARLAAAAATESIIRDEGWKTLKAEFKVVAEDNHVLGGLPITGTIDRIDVHPEKGLRILDYKTYSQPKNPSKTHVGPLREREYLPEAEMNIPTKKGDPRPRSWVDLQLPLYAWLAGRIWPEHAAKGVEVGYFLLPPDGDLSKDSLEIFQLTDEMQTSAEKCAARIAQLVKDGHFWPPAPSSQIEFDDFADWFMQEDPRNLIDEESAHRLDGNP
jgi:ATP-dependent helicase/nuclease subunit B